VHSVTDHYDQEAAAERLRQARRLADYETGTAAAQRFGWTVSTYLGHENGSRQYGPADAARYARAFRCRAPWLLFGGSMDEGAIGAAGDLAPAARGDEIPGYDVQDAPDRALIAAQWHLSHGRVDEAVQAARTFIDMMQSPPAGADQQPKRVRAKG
jgi:hypothetical protein